MQRLIYIEGAPKEVITDNGSHFTAHDVNAFLEGLDIKHIFVPLYSPSSNGLVERANRLLKEGLQTAVANSTFLYFC